MLKFQSSIVDAEALKPGLMRQNEQSGPVFKIREDPPDHPHRACPPESTASTRVPQFINVLRGDAVHHRAACRRCRARWRKLSLAAPAPVGTAEITCVWQVSGRNEISFEEWMYLGMQYIDLASTR